MEKKNIDASRLQNKFAEERLSDEKLDNVAGGAGVCRKAFDDTNPYGNIEKSGSGIIFTGKVGPYHTTGKK